MKKARKIITLILALVMVLSMSMTAWAAELNIIGTKDGESYDLYKVLDLTQAGDAYSYDVNEKFVNFFTNERPGWADPIAEIGKLEGDSQDLSELAQEILAWAIENGVDPVKTVKATDENATASDLEYGYYLLNPLGAQGAKGTATMFSMNTLSGEDTTITVKAEYPTIDKKVNDSDDPIEASIGDILTFTLETKVPDMTGYSNYYFVVKDKMSKGLAFQDIVSIEIGGDSLTETEDYTVEIAGGEEGQPTDIKIVFVDFYDKFKDATGEDVKIEYTAKLDTDAVIDSTGNDNAAKLIYSNDPKVETDKDEPNENDPNEPIGTTPEDQTITYTTELIINKTDGTNPLSGAAFRITGDELKTVVTVGEVFVLTTDPNAEDVYYKLINNTYTMDPYTPETVTQYAEPLDNKYIKTDKANIETIKDTVYAEAFVDDENATLTFSGLGAGEYTISEIVTPDGYNPIDPFTVTIAFDGDEFTYSIIGLDEDKLVGNTITVENKSGTLLPSTGGIGTTIFYIAGGVLVLVAVVLLVTKKRMKED